LFSFILQLFQLLELLEIGNLVVDAHRDNVKLRLS
jgi:hypothetical protein